MHLNLRLTAPCPCGSGNQVRHCDCYKGERLVRATPRSAPPGPTTGYGHPACFSRVTNNCSTERSKEHFLSDAILQRLNRDKKMMVSGLHWIPEGERRSLSPDALGSNVLCKRHNEAYSTLDQVALDLFDQLERISKECRERSNKKSVRLISGDAFELWSLKALCGFGSSKTAMRAGRERITEWNPPDSWVHVLEQRVAIPANVGLYFVSGEGTVNVKAHAAISPATDLDGDPVGIVFALYGYKFALAIGRPPDVAGTTLDNAVFHASHFVWTYQHQREPKHHLLLSWARLPGGPVQFTV